ncbi:MAG: SUMF1/EgtB/PvdO family nonheme iron enzyme [Bacteroidaceae bacterium]|nr:SUMF1/EgtB/PvdO family nonheme iron enzyme [Bacteroidaceae bacterium]
MTTTSSNRITLSELLSLNAKGRLSEDEAKSILSQLLSILEPMHSQQPSQLHLHINPDNITIDETGVVNLLPPAAGTVNANGYAPEEQLAGDNANIGTWTDCFALGATIYKLLTGQTLALDTLTERGGIDLNAFPAEISLPTRQLVQYMTRPVRYHRPRRIVDLQRFMADKGISLPAAPIAVEALLQQQGQQSAGPAFEHIDNFSTFNNESFNGSFSSAPDMTAPQQPAPSSQPQQKQKKKLSPLVWIIPLIVVLIGACAGLYFAQPKFVKNLFGGKKHSSELVEDDEEETDDESPSSRRRNEGVTVSRTSTGYRFNINGEQFSMIAINGGSFIMGNNDYQDEHSHQVTVSNFYIGQTEVTKELWQAVMGVDPNPSVDGPNVPAVLITYDDCLSFINALNDLMPSNCPITFRLPYEAEWEYAARGGGYSSTIWSGTDYSGSLSTYAWYDDNADNDYHAVATTQPNRFGIYDMSGNVWEWCYDWYNNSYYDNSPKTNPHGASSGDSRVKRGGCYSSLEGSCRATYRLMQEPSESTLQTGMRLAASK